MTEFDDLPLIGIIRAKSQNQWISCINITKNLELSYQKIARTKTFNLYSELPTAAIVQKILNSKISTLVFLDHRVRLLELLLFNELTSFLHKNRIKIIIHTYGCFYDRLEEYYQAGELLKGLEVTFVAASPAHQKLLGKFMSNDSTYFCPFPVNTRFFDFSEEERKLTREKYNISSDAPLIIYAGRISQAKNITLAMEYLAGHQQTNKAQFICAGHFDAYDPIWGYSYHGQMEYLLAKTQKRLDPKSHWFQHLPHLNFTDLKKLYAAADAYISFSTYRNEDYALSVAEAKCMGLPCFITNWAGHSTYQKLPETFMAPVQITEDDILIDASSLDIALKELTTLDLDRRKKIRTEAHNSLSIEAVSEKLLTLIKQPQQAFAGISQKEVFIRKMTRVQGFSFIKQTRHIYESYWN